MDLDSWLGERQLKKLLPLLREAGIDLDVLAELDEGDLAGIGMTLGDRKRLIRAIKTSADMPGAVAGPETGLRVHSAPGGGAERRHLTVMFCDLVGSTELATRLDPEDLRQVIDDYHQVMAAAVVPYEGFIAQFLGDGVLAYFGYPKAHEDDGHRAVRAALAVVDRVYRLSQRRGIDLQIRVGIASGLVVVGQIGAGTLVAEQSASGETPSMAARLQSKAQPGQIIVSEETRQLLGSAFELEVLDSLELKGFKGPLHAWRIVSERPESSRFEAQHALHLSKLIGRESEVSMLMDRWQMLRDYEGQVILLTGEAGIGKSRIAEALLARMAEESVDSLLWQCSPYFENGALYPVIRQLERFAQVNHADPPQLNADKLHQTLVAMGMEVESVNYLAKLLGLPDGGLARSQQTAEQVKAATLQAVTDCVERASQRRPVLLLVEDAHWIDPTTEELLGLAIEQLRDARVMILVTARPEYAPRWGNPTNLTRLVLGRLGQRQCAALISAVAGSKALPADVLAQIVKKTDGIPLFVEELTKTVVESGLLKETPNGYELKGPLLTLSIPSTLQDSLMARLDRLAPAKEVAQVAAVIGRDFEQKLLAAVMNMSEAALGAALNELVRAELVLARGSGYTFKHALVRDTAYNSMVRSQRALRHGQIACAIESGSPELTSSQPDLLAHHHQEAGHTNEALRYWTAAGDRAFSQSDARESSRHYLNALNLVHGLPAGADRNERELILSLKRGHALYATEGYASVAVLASFENARGLARDLGRAEDFMDAWVGSAPTLFSIGRPSEAIEKLKEAGEIQMSSLDPRLRIAAALMTGVAHYLMGEITEACHHFETARILDDDVNLTHLYPAGGGDPAVVVRAYEARAKFLQGFLDRGESLCDEGMSIARLRGHAPTIAWATQVRLGWLALRGDWPRVILEAEQSLESCERLGFKTRVATSLFRLGQARAALGDVENGIDTMRRGYDLWALTGGKFHLTEYSAQAAHELVKAGRYHDARAFVLEGQTIQKSTDERHYAAELLRLSGEILQNDGDVNGAEALFRDAFQLAEKAALKLFSLRAAASLARLLKAQGLDAEARAILHPTFRWFNTPLDYPDLHSAKAVLDSLA